LLAFGLPSVILYFRLVLAIVAGGSRVTHAQSLWLFRLSNVALLAFLVVQLIAARSVQRLVLPAPRTSARGILQYIGVVLICGACSITGAILLESVAYNVIVRVLDSSTHVR
jgi:hypothetical protein